MNSIIIYMPEELIWGFIRDGMASTCGKVCTFPHNSWRRLALSSSWWTHQTWHAASAFCQSKDTTCAQTTGTQKVVSVPLHLFSAMKVISNGLDSWGMQPLLLWMALSLFFSPLFYILWELLDLGIWCILLFHSPITVKII